MQELVAEEDAMSILETSREITLQATREEYARRLRILAMYTIKKRFLFLISVAIAGAPSFADLINI